MTLTSADTRRIKKLIHAAKHSVTIRYPRGWQDIVLQELHAVLASMVHCQEQAAEVSDSEGQEIRVYQLDFRSLLELPERLLTARDIYWHLGQGRAGSLKELRRSIQKIPWPLILPAEATIALRVNSVASHLFHEGRLHELLAEELSGLGYRIQDKTKARHLLEMQLEHDRVSLQISLSGSPLFKRGYKTTMVGKASVHEDIAAAATLAAGIEANAWRPRTIYVPFAGSGTLGFEAVIAACKLPPFIFGRRYAYEDFVCAPTASQAHLRRKLLERASEAMQQTPHLLFIDRDAEQCQALRDNCTHFNRCLTSQGLPTLEFTILCEDALKFAAPAAKAQGPLFIPLNPPYGLRLADKTQARQLYRAIKPHLLQLKQNFKAYIFAPEVGWLGELIEAVHAKQASPRPFIHGGRRILALDFSLNFTDKTRK